MDDKTRQNKKKTLASHLRAALRELAMAQSGCFTSAQANERGVSDSVLAQWARVGKLERRHRGIYRLPDFPPSEDEDLVVAWLWSQQRGVISHETALQLHQLSDAMPARIHLTLPLELADRAREWKVPDNLVLHFADIPEAHRTWTGPVPVTRPARSVNDVAEALGDPLLVEQAANQGIRHLLFGVRDVVSAVRYLGAQDRR